MDKDNKILFLDFDGVITTRKSWLAVFPQMGNGIDLSGRFWEDGKVFDVLQDELIAKINRITMETSAKIVISSNWRRAVDFDRLKMGLKNHGLVADVIDHTPIYKSMRPRGQEIDWWLAENGATPDSNYVIIDDDTNMMEYQLPRFVETDFEIGITDFEVEQAIQILKGKTNAFP